MIPKWTGEKVHPDPERLLNQLDYLGKRIAQLVGEMILAVKRVESDTIHHVMAPYPGWKSPTAVSTSLLLGMMSGAEVRQEKNKLFLPPRDTWTTRVIPTNGIHAVSDCSRVISVASDLAIDPVEHRTETRLYVGTAEVVSWFLNPDIFDDHMAVAGEEERSRIFFLMARAADMSFDKLPPVFQEKAEVLKKFAWRDYSNAKEPVERVQAIEFLTALGVEFYPPK